MKNLFPSFYRMSPEEFQELWAKCIFVFDTNILLETYSYTPETAQRIFNLLQRIKDRIWLPHYVALEFHRNRLSVINKANTEYKEIQAKLESILTLETVLPVLTNSTTTQKGRINNLIEELLKELERFQSERTSDYEQDRILDQISNLFSDRIGTQIPDNDFSKWEKEAEERFKEKRPPGFEDDKEKDTEAFFFNGRKYQAKYGDFFIWKQILNKMTVDHREQLIFITNDIKFDWWEYVNPKSKNRRLGPRRELIEEASSVGIRQFWTYTFDRFLEEAKSYLNFNVDQDVLNEVKDISSKYDEDLNAGMLAENAVRRWIEEKYYGKGFSFNSSIDSAEFGVDILATNSAAEKIIVEVFYSSREHIPKTKFENLIKYAKQDKSTTALFVFVTDRIETAHKVINQYRLTKFDVGHVKFYVGTLEIDNQGFSQFKVVASASR